MKKLNILKLLTALAITGVFTGCGCKDKEQLYLPQDFKDCRTFPEGSWWIYAVNGISFDTLTLIKQKIIPPETPTEQTDCLSFEEFSCSYESSSFEQFNIIHLNGYIEKYYGPFCSGMVYK